MKKRDWCFVFLLFLTCGTLSAQSDARVGTPASAEKNTGSSTQIAGSSTQIVIISDTSSAPRASADKNSKQSSPALPVTQPAPNTTQPASDKRPK